MMRHLGRFLKKLLRPDIPRQTQVATMSEQDKARGRGSKIAVCQMTSIGDKAVNYNIVQQLISDAVKEDVQMIFFPEACDYLCDNKEDIVKNAEPILTGETMKRYRELAAEHDVWLSMGGVHELDETNPSKMYNTHVIINNKGEIVQTYRKLHLFDVEIPERKLRLKESDFSNAGSHIVSPVDTPVGRVGMAICYDMRFPELSTALSILNAEVLTYPSAFTHATGVAHWHSLLRARAIESQCYVVAAAQAGQHNLKRRSYGHALVADPWGEVIVDLRDASPALGLAHISLDKLQSVRTNMPVFQHRRKDIYSLHALSLRKALPPEHGGPSTVIGPQGPSQAPTPAGEGPSFEFGHVRVPDTCVFYKSDLSFAFVNLRCVIPGHVLVAPIRAAERNQDLTDEEAQDFYRTVRLVQRLMEKVHNTNSCTVTIQDGPFAGQTVKHLHCHVMPRTKGDFIENDLIYLELHKHDHKMFYLHIYICIAVGRPVYLELHKHDRFKSGHPAKPARSREEMEAEAAMLRDEMDILLSTEKPATV